MKQILYVSQFNLLDPNFNRYLIENFSNIECIVTNQVAFMDLINNICQAYELDDDMFDVFRRSVSNTNYAKSFPLASRDYAFAILDYLYYKYADNKLSKCALLRIIYMYDINIFIYDASCFNLLVPFAYSMGKQVVTTENELVHLKSSVSNRIYNFYHYNLNGAKDIFFIVLNRYLDLPANCWRDILERNNDS